MILDEDFEIKKYKENIKCKCNFCKKDFLRIKRNLRGNGKTYHVNFCTSVCQKNYNFNNNYFLVSCKNCNKEFYKNKYNFKGKNNFCSQSCNALYNNARKTKGTRISKLEVWLASNLTTKYPDLKFHFNRKDAINSELDIYIPFLKLAFELNGIFHYEPIYGNDKLNQIQNNDNRKFQACLEHDIELCIIDTSSQKYFSEKNCLKYLDIVSNIVDSKLEQDTGI